ncbi:MAG TPA: hypothetical protein VG737_02360 [Cyclobacteriaceae bacterium]|nr:hypothetical protein [Cyclobacteriaceae bacterium]
MPKAIFGVSVFMLLISCAEDKPKIDYENSLDTASVIDTGIKDTTKILVSELPVKFDSTETLLFAIGLVDLQERGGYSKIGSNSYSPSDIASSYFDHDYLIGNFINIVFQAPDGKERKLTDKRIRIVSVNFLRPIFKKENTAYLLYTLYDRDSNNDNQLDHSDLEALYISKLDGSDFRKLSKELHEFYDWRLLEGENRIYFRTLEDKNKDGRLNNKDKFHYYRIEFSGQNYSLSEYNPVNIFE